MGLARATHGRTVVAVWAVAVAAALGGCASRGSTGAPPVQQVIPGAGEQTAPTTASPGSGAAPQPPSGGGSATGGASAQEPTGPPCRSSQLAVKVVEAKQGSVGYSDWLFELRNTSTSTCTVAGWPTVSLLDGQRQPLVTNEKRGAGPALTGRVATTVPLPAGAAAVFGIETYKCGASPAAQAPAPQVLVTPPTDTVPLLTPVDPPVTSCADGLVVTSPVRADPSGVAS